MSIYIKQITIGNIFTRNEPDLFEDFFFLIKGQEEAVWTV